jgi:hypothetical protein
MITDQERLGLGALGSGGAASFDTFVNRTATSLQASTDG